MELTGLLIAAATLGGVWAGACEEQQQHGRLPPLLVTSASQVTVYAWPEQAVDLQCRPSQAGGCQWLKGSKKLGSDCRLKTTERGTIKCLRGDETCGSITLNNPRDQDVQHTEESSYDYYSHEYYGYIDRYWNYRGETRWSHKFKTFLCSQSGTIILKSKVCDGTNDCGAGEDEWNCSPPCGPPFVRQHSRLSDPKEAYPDGSRVTYVCDHGFSSGESLSGVQRTCSDGRWTEEAPICQRSAALNRTVSVTGQPMTDCAAAVDGDLNTWCMLAPSAGPQTVAVRLEANVSVSKVLVRALGTRYTVALRPENSTGSELSCPCEELAGGRIKPAVSGVRVCSCPEQSAAESQQELLVRAEQGAFMSLTVAEIVALERQTPDDDECARLGHPAHGRYESAGSGAVKLSCEPGHAPSCTDAVQCSALRSGAVRLSCLAASCSQPPAIPNTKFGHRNGTGWGATVQYSCAAGYALYPATQNTTASCDSDGLWTLSHISCLSETDIRVVAMRLGEQHERSMSALRAELEALLVGQQRLLAEQNSTQQRLSKLEQDVALLGLAEGAYLQPVAVRPADDSGEASLEETEAETEDAIEELHTVTKQTVLTRPERQPEETTESAEPQEAAAEAQMTRQSTLRIYPIPIV